jgi:opacity protein-like surface antigen
MRNLASLVLLACTLSATARSRAQALPTASGRGSFQIGGGASLARPDYGGGNIEGISGYAGFDFTSHIGAELDVHYVALNTPTDLAENTYFLGPRVLLTRGRFTPYAKFLAGAGSLVIQESADNPGKYSGTYFAYGFGGGLDIRLTHHIVVRALDGEYQKWPSLGNGLSPFVVTVGAAYKFR